MSILETVKLNLSYGNRRGIRDVSLSVSEGQIFGFLGPNGAGKSTTIRILMGLLKASSGTAQIFGRNCWSDGAEIRREVGYVAGDVRLYPWLTLQRGLKLIGQIYKRDVQTRGMLLAERFSMETTLPVWKMSRGNRQKVALILAMAPNPRVLILDEPTSGLDPLMQDTLMLCLREMSQGGHTILFSSHLLSEVESLCDKIAIIRDGQIVENAMLADLQAKAPRRVVVTLPLGHDAIIPWPEMARLTWSPASQSEATISAAQSGLTGIPPARLHRTCLLEVHGSGAEFLQWAAAQSFEDISISPPSLESMFRSYYYTDKHPAKSTR